MQLGKLIENFENAKKELDVSYDNLMMYLKENGLYKEKTVSDELDKPNNVLLIKGYIGGDIDESLSMAENLDNYCEKTSTNVKITNDRRAKVFYRNDKVGTHCVNLVKTGSTLQATNTVDISQLNTIQGEVTDEFSADVYADFIEKTGYDVKNNTGVATRHILYKVFSGKASEKLTKDEIEICELARGPISYIKSKNYELKKVSYSYDINSHHPYLLQHSEFKFPVRSGKSCVVEKIDDDETIACYALQVNQNDLKWFALTNNKANREKIWYSNYDVKYMRMMGVKFNLLKPVDGEFNCIMYNNYDCVTGSSIFGETVSKLYAIKSNKLVKSILQKLLGNITKKKFKRTHEKDIAANEEYDSVEVNDDGSLTMVKFNGLTCSHARMKPFFYGFMRYDLYKNHIHGKHYDIIRIKSDSLLIEGKEFDSVIGTDIGEFKREMRYAKGLVYPHCNYSFKTNVNDNVTFWDEDEKAYCYADSDLENESESEEDD